VWLVQLVVQTRSQSSDQTETAPNNLNDIHKINNAFQTTKTITITTTTTTAAAATTTAAEQEEENNNNINN
jgi:hypothetical protein